MAQIEFEASDAVIDAPLRPPGRRYGGRLGVLPRGVSRLLGAGGRAFMREAGVAAAGALVYFLIRGAVSDRVGEATARAVDLMELERALGLFWEPAMQGWILSSRLLIDAMNAVYFWFHMPLIIVLAILLYLRRRPIYRFTRNAFLFSAVIALAMYFTLPVTPPRLLPEFGFVDTVALYSAANYQAQEIGPFVNAYAALPSLHFGWALLLGLAIWRARPGGRGGAALAAALALLLSLGQFIAVLTTANHFVLDVFAGAAVAAAGAGLAWWWQRRGAARSPARSADPAGRLSSSGGNAASG